MLDKLNEIEKAALESLSSINDQAALDAWRIANVGRSSPLMQVFAEFGKLSKEEKPVIGVAANRVKVALETALEEKAQAGIDKTEEFFHSLGIKTRLSEYTPDYTGTAQIISKRFISRGWLGLGENRKVTPADVAKIVEMSY